MVALGTLAGVVQSKNAGPFEITFDVLFRDPDVFAAVVASGCLDAAAFATAYGVRAEDVDFVVYEPGQTFKFTMPRPVASGDIGDTDVFGAQQHVPLLSIDVTLPTGGTT